MKHPPIKKTSLLLTLLLLLAIATHAEERSLRVTTQRAGTLAAAIRTQGVSFSDVSHLTIAGPLNSDDIFVIRDSLTALATLDMSEAAIAKLPKEAFRRCPFSSILLPTTLRDMGNSAFSSCTNLEELVIPEGVLLADNLVYNCPGLHRIDLPSTLVSAKELMFALNWSETETYRCTITCRAFFPPKTSTYLVNGYGLMDIRLQVPAVSAANYAAASGWKSLPLQTIDDVPQHLTVLGRQTLDTDGLPDGYKPDLNLLQHGSYGGYGANNAFGLLTVTGSKALNIGAFTSYTDLFSDRSYTGRFGGELIAQAPMTAESVTLSLDFHENRWCFLSLPFDVKLSEVVTSPDIHNWVVRTYSGSNRAAMLGEQWIDVPYSGTLEARRGYVWMVSNNLHPEDYERQDLRVTLTATSNTRNNMFVSGDVSIPLADHPSTYAHNAGWNLVGNPYPCYYRIGALKQTAPITVRSGYYSYEQYDTYSPVDDANRELHPYEAFFVQSPAAGSTLVFGAEGRVMAGSNARSLMPAAAANEDRQLINLTLTTDDNLTDRTRVVLNAAAKDGYECERDAAKFFSSSEHMPQLYTLIGQEPCAINERPEADGTVVVGIRTGSEQQCVIALDNKSAHHVLLEDRHTGILTDLTTDSYTFLSRQGRDDHRFLLHVGASATGISDGSLQPTTGTRRLYNLQGQPVSDSYRGPVIHENGRITIKH